MRFLDRLCRVIRRRSALSELDEELQFHLEHEIATNLARGLPPAEARRIALRDLGGLPQTRDAASDVYRFQIESVWREVKLSARALRRTPVFTLVAAGTLTLTIGAAAAAFSIVDAVLIRRLPFDHPDRLVAVWETTRTHPDAQLGWEAPQNFYDWRERQSVFTGLAASAYGEISVKGPNDALPEHLPARQITANMFDVLRVAPALGRGFTVEDEVPGHQHVAVISYQLWQRRYGGSRDVIGKQLPGQLASFDIVGVMPRTFADPVAAGEAIQVWLPFVPPADARIRGNDFGYYLVVIGRLRDGVTVGQAQTQISAITEQLAAETPRWFENRVPVVAPLQDALTGDVRRWMLMLLGAIGCVLVIAVVNLATLMLGRASTRQHELSVRASLGASRGALVRAPLIESLLLSSSGALFGAVLAGALLGAVRPLLPSDLPRAAAIAVNWRIVIAATGVAVAAGTVFGIAPVWRLVRTSSIRPLGAPSRSSTAGRRSTRIRGILVTAEIALAVVLLVGAGLFLVSFARVSRIDLGFDYTHVLAVQVRPLLHPGDEATGTGPLFAVLDRVRAFPGVGAAALSGGGLPLRGDLQTQDFTLSDAPEIAGDIALNEVSPDYFRALGIPLRQGRGFSDADRQGTLPAVILNETAARRFFGGDRAIGRRMDWKHGVGQRTVVGIVGDIRFFGPESKPRPQAFIPLAQSRASAATLLLRLAPRVDVLPGIGKAIDVAFAGSQVPGVDVDVQTLDDFYGDLLAQRRLNMYLLGAFGLLGIIIAVVGMYGVMAYMVEQRTREIGIRISLGAPPRQVLRAVLARAARYVAVGLITGGFAAWAGSTMLADLLFGIRPHDRGIYLAVAALVTSIALMAALVPARRAARIDPIVALRLE